MVATPEEITSDPPLAIGDDISPKRFIMIISLVLCCAACAPPPPAPTSPITQADYRARENCLYSTICKMIRERGTTPIILDGIAEDAASICSGPLYLKMRQQARSLQEISDQITDTHIDHAIYSRHALAVALQQSDDCSRR